MMHIATLPQAPHSITTLANGLRVVSTRLPHLARSHISVHLRGGPMHESDDTWGMSHVLEHMVFRGTKRHKDARAVSLVADDFGGDLNAATYRDHVVFDTRCDPDRVHAAIQLLGDMLGAPRFEGLAVEKGIIEAELADLYDDRGQEIDIDNASFRQAFPGDALSRSIEGTPEAVRKVTKQRLTTFHGRLYGASNIVISVAGPVEHSAVVASAVKHLRHLPQGRPPSLGTAPKVSASDSNDVVVIRTEDGQTQLRLSARTVGFSSRGDAAASACAAVLARVLDDGPASRLQHEVIDRDGLAYSAWAMLDQYEHRGLLSLQAEVQHERVPLLVDAFLGQLKALAKTPPSVTELRRVVQRAGRDARDLMDDPAGVAEAAGRAVLFDEPFDLAGQLARFAAVRPKHVSALASSLLQEMKLVLVGLPRAKDVAHIKRMMATL